MITCWQDDFDTILLGEILFDKGTILCVMCSSVGTILFYTILFYTIRFDKEVGCSNCVDTILEGEERLVDDNANLC